ncbi:MAG TPA: ABC transporter ATP-binding protein [Alphaproteobacteria bacterium]|nr:ABC transporter ATP-binding protein [Alphaproteobacteria bacterium]
MSKRYGPVEAVQGVSLDVERGAFVSLLGPSGCGKSTILRMIAGFERPDGGRIYIDGSDVVDVPAHRRPVNMVFQSYALFPHLTVFDNVAFGLRRKRLAREVVKEQSRHFLGLVGLEGMEARYPSQLSGGQQQRVALARALANRPKVLLLDEPLGALDLKLRKRMQVELKQLQREVGITFIYVTHDQDEALALSDQIAVMNRGELLQYGPGRELYDSPASEFVANFLGEANLLPCRILQQNPSPAVDIGGTAIAVASLGDGAREVGAAALLVLRPEDLAISREPPLGPCRLPAQIEDKVFLGASFLIYLRLDGDIPLTARGSDRAFFDSVDAGGKVWVGWQAERARLVAP